MRVSTSWSQQLSVNAMQAQQAKVSKTQMQLSSGLNILTPADDPVGASKILAFEADIKQTEQYQRNIDTVRARNDLEETALEGAEQLLLDAKDFAIQAVNGSLSANDKLIIKAEVDQILLSMAGVANTQNANGEYIFSGDLSKTQSVTLAAGTYGDTGGTIQRELAISPLRRVDDGDLAKDVFFDIDSVSPEAAARPAPDTGKQSVFRTLQKFSDALVATYTVPPANSGPEDLYSKTMANVMSDLDSAFESITTTKGSVGSRLNALDGQEELNDKIILDMETVLSSIQDLDYTEAITRFESESLVLTAAQQAYSKVKNLSLFNYL